MRFSIKKTCKSCRAFVQGQGCVFDVKVELQDDNAVPKEPCYKPVSHADMEMLCEDSEKFTTMLNSWRTQAHI